MFKNRRHAPKRKCNDCGRTAHFILQIEELGDALALCFRCYAVAWFIHPNKISQIG